MDPRQLTNTNYIGKDDEGTDNGLKIHGSRTTDCEKYSFNFQNVLFGELIGKCIEPVEVTNNRMYFNISCSIKRNTVSTMEGYRFSLSANDIEVMHAHLARTPAFVAIETSRGFANAVCKRIGSDVLCPDSTNARKRYILLTGNQGIPNNAGNDIEYCDLVMCASKWARVNLLSYRNAFELVSEYIDSFPNKIMRHEKRLFKRIRKLLPKHPTPLLDDCCPTPSIFVFKCNKVKFGKLFGKSVAPVKVAQNRMYFEVKCVVKRRHKICIEKYTFSVGATDLTGVSVYIGHMPSFIVLETTPKFATAVCKRIGRKVLCPGAENSRKRYIFLLIDPRYNETYQAVKMTEERFVRHVSGWTQLTLLSSDEALQLLRDV